MTEKQGNSKLFTNIREEDREYPVSRENEAKRYVEGKGDDLL